MKVKFVPMDKELEIKPGQSVMSLAHENGINILSVCNGMPSCAECRVKVIENDHNVLPPSSKELSLIGTGYFLDQRRLSCQLLCFGDITVDVSEQIEKANEAKVNKKFLKRAQKANAEDSHALNGILIEQEQEILNEISKESEQRQNRPRNEHRRNDNRQKSGGQNADGDLLAEMQSTSTEGQNRNPNARRNEGGRHEGGRHEGGRHEGGRHEGGRPEGGRQQGNREQGNRPEGGGNRENRQGGGGGGNRNRNRRRRR